MRSIENIWRLFYEDQNSRNSPTQLDEDILGFKRVITNIVEHTFEEKYFKSPTKMCRNCGKMKKAGRKMVIAVDAARRFAYFGKHPQQPSSVRLVSTLATTVPRFQSGHETVYALERHSKWEDIPYAQEQRLSPRITKKNETQERISSQRRRKLNLHSQPLIRGIYSNKVEADQGLFHLRGLQLPQLGLNSPSRYQRTSSWESTYSTYSRRHLGSVAPNTSYNEYSSGNEREPHPRGRTLDHRRRSLDYSCSSSRSTFLRIVSIESRRSPDEVYSHRRNRGSNVHPSNHSTDKVGWFRRIRNKLGFHHRMTTTITPPNGKLHRQSNDRDGEKEQPKNTVKNEPKQHGHVESSLEVLLVTSSGSNKSKPSTAGNVVRKKPHWWRKIHRQGSSNVGKSRAKLVMKTKYPKSKGYKHNTKMKKLLLVHRKWCNSVATVTIKH
ncbi:hypothetical protein MKW92_022690 [Papaver armeniacum]|nr:hypothetical protein MKW92_022690 [Papaver armeniacum]